MLMPGVALAPIEFLVTGRTSSMFGPDMARNDAALRTRFSGRRVAIIGAAGSIGSSVLRALLPYAPGALVLFDLNENMLVEVVRDLRSSEDLAVPALFEALPIGMGSLEFARYLREQPPFDVVFNLSALKHVRSEKSVYSLIRLLDTNCVFVADLLETLARTAPVNVFSVSSDKAVNPASLMGASKLAMERVMAVSGLPYSTARFANVAFSEGSLPQGFLRRLQKGQPLSAPNDVVRYFISHEEAGQLCVLAAGLMDGGETLVPRMDAVRHTQRFDEIARRVIRAHGYEPVECASDNDARARSASLIAEGRWPCYFSPSDTSGEKPYEEFFDETSRVDDSRFEAVQVVAPPTLSTTDRDDVGRFLKYLRTAKHDATQGIDDYAAALGRVVPGLRHVRTGRSLDEKM
jgi:FlaA1/EpsC-like NDP-sugar epimerase